ncbi:MAG: (d)CMP kinase [Alphaproteobacteria bacterium]|nr:cytidylate kinase [Rhodobiaceae bacterium]MDC0070884.1 (d)CMP kinase [Rhodobiaceae bacterium]|tara:strand:+ start:1352 stop:1993 length:642 start_codon:yes stop_codon:yes gene_type:complete
MTFTVAIDGLAGSGKGTLALALADKFNLAYFDTGLLYRGLAYIALDEFGEDFTKTNVINIAKSFRVNTLKESNLRSPILGKYASEIGAIPEVRKILIKIQREFKEKSPSNKGIVVDGRDIGTVIFPNANVKLFISASLEERARRRLRDFLTNDENISYDEVIKQLQKRDQRDKERSVAPLVAAKDAHLIDTTNINKEETLEIASSLVAKKLSD